MEELKTAISAMKQAEETLAKQGFILQWKVRVKANQGFFRNMVSRLIADTAVPATETEGAPERVPEAAPKEAKTKSYQPKNLKVLLPEQAADTPETPQETAQNTETVDEEQPVTALDSQSAASYLEISLAGVYDLVKRGRIPAHGKPGKRWFLTEELDKYRQEREKRHAVKKL